MSWTAKPTGNMTLSVVDEQNFQILKIDMLSYGTMVAGSNGEILARSMNNLTVIAGFSDHHYDVTEDDLPYSDAGISPWPWSVNYNHDRKKLVIKDKCGKKLCERIFPKGVSMEQISYIVELLTEGCKQFCFSGNQ